MNSSGSLLKSRELVFPLILIIFFAIIFLLALRWQWRTSLMPAIAAGAGILFGVFEIVRVAQTEKRGKQTIADDTNSEQKYTGDLTYESKSLYQGIIFFVWVGAFFLGVLLLGFHVSIPLFAFLYVKVEGKAPWLLSILLPVFLLGFVIVVFDWLMDIAWSAPLLFRWLRAFK